MFKHHFSDDGLRKNVKQSKPKKITIFSAMNPKRLRNELDRYGCEFSVKQYIFYMFIVFFCMVVAGFVFKLHIQAIIPIILLGIVFMPNIFVYHYRNLYEQKKFEDISNYIEQLLYSFGRQPKILTALEDTLILFEADPDSQLAASIQMAIQYIRSGRAKENIYEEAFAFIEADYGCKRLYKVHRFLIHAEESGGDFTNSINLLIMDRNLWMDRIYSFIHDKKRLRVNVTIAIGLSLLITGMSIYMVPESFHITDQPLSQIVTCICLCIDFTLWFVVQKILAGSLLDVDRDQPYKTYQRSYKIVMDEERLKKKKRNFTIAGIVMFVAAAITFYLIGIQAAILFVILGIFIITNPQHQYNTCLKRVTKEIEKAFPEWLMSFALQLQSDNVHVSIVKTIPEAPEILQPELYKFQDSIQKHPNELEPYINFANKFRINNITSAMKQIYASVEFGSEDMQEQIKELVERNIKIMERSEALKMEDALAGVSFTMLLPMITGAIKLLVDLVMVMYFILSYSNGL